MKLKLILIALIFNSALFAQIKNITGKVLNAEDKKPIVGATVKIKDTNLGTVSNFEGDFYLSTSNSYAKVTIVVEYIGMKTKEVEIVDSKYITIELRSSDRVETQSNVKNTVNSKTNNYLPEKKYSDNFNFTKIKNDLKVYKNVTVASYHKTSFVNNNFANSIENSSITNFGGVELMGKVFGWSPIIFDYGGYWDFYKTQTMSEIFHFGAKLSLSVVLLPTSKAFAPYAGFGYQLSTLVAGDASIDTSAPIWKVGIQSITRNGVILNFEYTQSFLVPHRLSNQIAIGIGLAY